MLSPPPAASPADLCPLWPKYPLWDLVTSLGLLSPSLPLGSHLTFSRKPTRLAPTVTARSLAPSQAWNR